VRPASEFTIVEIESMFLRLCSPSSRPPLRVRVLGDTCRVILVSFWQLARILRLGGISSQGDPRSSSTRDSFFALRPSLLAGDPYRAAIPERGTRPISELSPQLLHPPDFVMTPDFSSVCAIFDSGQSLGILVVIAFL